MHDALQKEIATYEKRTPKSAAAHKRALQRIPLGVASNYRHYEPYPLFVKDGKAGRIHDVDGNEYVDHNLCFGALMAGHCHPAVVKAVTQKLNEGTTFGMPHEQEWELAEDLDGSLLKNVVYKFRASQTTDITAQRCVAFTQQLLQGVAVAGLGEQDEKSQVGVRGLLRMCWAVHV